MRWNLIVVHLLFTLLPIVSFSQSSSGTIGNWLMLFNQTRLHNKWSIYSEAQYRSFEIAPNSEQLLLRAGLNYHINNTSLFSAGYGYINNYKFDKELFPGLQSYEHRSWQQLIMRNNIDRFYFEHRYRLEQRWLQSNNNNRYLDRVRYLLRVTVPINKNKIGKNTLFVTLYDELFIHFNSTPFDRNRLYGAIGYQFMENANIQLGYLAQTVNITTKEYLQAAIFYNLDFRKKG